MQGNERADWLAKRRQCITGTDIAAICGVHRYKSAVRVWQEKLGLVEEPDLTDNSAVEWGQRLERIVADAWAEKNKRAIFAGSLIVQGLFGGTTDFLIDGYDDEGLEVKTGGFYTKSRWGENGEQTIPDEYYLQCQWYMMLKNAKRWHVAALLAGNDYRQYTIERNDRLIARLQEIAKSFWNDYVLTETMPPADGSESTRKALNAAHPQDDGETLVAEYEDEELAVELHNTQQKLKELEAHESELKNKLIQKLGDSSAMLGKDFRITWKAPKPRAVVDYKNLIKDLAIDAEIVKRYTKDSATSRRFTFKYTGE